MAQNYFALERYEEAVDLLQRRLARQSDSDVSLVLLAACYGHLGRAEDAHAACGRNCSASIPTTRSSTVARSCLTRTLRTSSASSWACKRWGCRSSPAFADVSEPNVEPPTNHGTDPRLRTGIIGTAGIGDLPLLTPDKAGERAQAEKGAGCAEPLWTWSSSLPKIRSATPGGRRRRRGRGGAPSLLRRDAARSAGRRRCRPPT